VQNRLRAQEEPATIPSSDFSRNSPKQKQVQRLVVFELTWLDNEVCFGEANSASKAKRISFFLHM